MRRVADSCRCSARNAYHPAVALRAIFPVESSFPSRHFTLSAQRHDALGRPQSSGEREEEPVGIARQGMPFKFKKTPRTREIVEGNLRQVDDIYPQDLTRTLEAHRASNQAALVRRIDARTERRPQSSINVRQPRPDLGSTTRNAAPRTPSKQGRTPKSFREPTDEYTGALEEHWAASQEGPEKEHWRVSHASSADALKIVRQASTAGLTERLRRKIKGRKPGTDVTSLEYTARCIEPICPTVIMDHKLPWYVGGDEHDVPLKGIQKLSLEIERFHAYVKPNHIHKAARHQAVIDIANEVQFRTHGFETEIFGSEKTGLALVTSDIDLRFGVPRKPGTRLAAAPPFFIRNLNKEGLVGLHKILHGRLRYLKLSEPRTFGDHIQLLHSRYSLIHLSHRATGLDVQVVASNDSSKAQEIVREYLTRFPGLEEVYCVVKSMLDCRGLTEVFKGGVGAYPLFIMVAASFMLNPNLDKQSLGEKLMSFLSFWSRFDTYTNGVSLDPPAIFKKVKKSSHQVASEDPTLKARGVLSVTNLAQPYLMVLQDPADPMNDLMHKSFAIKYVQETMRKLCDGLLIDLHTKPTGSLLEPLLGPTFSLYLMRRRKLEAFGTEVLQKTEGASVEEKLAILRQKVDDATRMKTVDEVLDESRDKMVCYRHYHRLSRRDVANIHTLEKFKRTIAEDEREQDGKDGEQTSHDDAEDAEISAMMDAMPSDMAGSDSILHHDQEQFSELSAADIESPTMGDETSDGATLPSAADIEFPTATKTASKDRAAGDVELVGAATPDDVDETQSSRKSSTVV